MTDFLDDYGDAADRTERYRLLRAEMTRLRGDAIAAARADDASSDDYYDRDAVGETVRELAAGVGGDLLAFAGNDFGYPTAYRPAGVDRDRQDEVHEAILREKYDPDQDDLAEVRDRLIDRHPQVHAAVIAVLGDDDVRYHLPEGSEEGTTFLTVREMVGLVDYATNSAQAEDLSRTY